MHHVGRMLVCAIWGELAAGLQSPPAAGVPSWLHGSGVLNLRDLHYPNHPLGLVSYVDSSVSGSATKRTGTAV